VLRYRINRRWVRPEQAGREDVEAVCQELIYSARGAWMP
jgi:hypothetical protein